MFRATTGVSIDPGAIKQVAGITGVGATRGPMGKPLILCVWCAGKPGRRCCDVSKNATTKEHA